MKFDIPDNDIVTVGALKTKAISISANAKAYRLIFGQIYPDIIKAIVRELFTNAWDSQKVAGNLDTPIDIHLPTAFEPWFSIRDYGTGMSEEVIDDVYTRVFESTKDDSDEEAGMFGMGSKTPLGYTDSFAITSYTNGMMRAYSIYINKAGEAELALQYEGETEEPNGVYVQVSVKNDDFDSFKNHAETFALHAGTAININRERVLNTRKELMSGENWTLYEDNDKFEEAMFIRMGCVLYRLDTHMLFDNLPDSAGWHKVDYHESNYVRRLFKMPLIIDFNIGDFQVTGSREDIIYNADAALRIYKRVMEEVIVEIQDQIQFDVANAETFGEAWRLGRIYSRNSLLTDKGFRSLKWKSWLLCRAETMINHHTRSDFSFNPYSNRSGIIMRSFTKKPINLSEMYDPDVITYVVLDDGSSKRVYSRLLNLYANLQASGMTKSSYYSNMYKSGKPKQFAIMWVQTQKANLKRLQTILPTNHIIVKMEDVLVQPPKKREEREEVEIDYSVYHVYTGRQYSDGLAVGRYASEEPRSEYFVRTYRRRFNESDAKIVAAAVALNVELKNVVAINKMSEHCIEHHDLLDLIEEADKVRDSIEYNESTHFKNALSELSGRFDMIRYWAHAPEIVARMMKITYIASDVNENYVQNVNAKTEATHHALREQIISFIQELYVKYPLLKFINHNFVPKEDEITQIMTTLGEI